MRLSWLFCVFVLVGAFCNSSFSQPFAGPWQVGLNTSYGFVYRHTPALGGITQAHQSGVEIVAEKITTGRRYWEQAYRYPRTGLAMGYYNFATPQLGKAIYLIHYLDKPILRTSSHELSYKVGLGAEYSSRTFDLENNFQNIALSSRFSYAMRGGIAYSLRIKPEWQLTTGITLTHFSNGAFKMPNAGINLAMFSLGIFYRPNASRIVFNQIDSVPAYSKKINYHLSGAFLIKETRLPGGKKFPGFMISAYLSRRLNFKSALTLGLDGFYSPAIRWELENDREIDQTNRPDFKRLGLSFGHELYISRRLSMLTQVGYYLYRPYKTVVDAFIYQRYGLKYAVGKRFFGAMLLKAHYGTADFVEWTWGVKLGK